VSSLKLDHLSKHYGEAVIVRDLSLEIANGEFVSLLGPSGCGKTTVLRMVAGLIAPSGGKIAIGEREITVLPPNKRRIGLVFQSYALFPHLTVFENVAFGLRRQGVKGAELEKRVKDALALVRLDAFGDRYPRQMSGGQQQRVAMARAIAPRPDVLLFDEPLSNLDAKLRDEMQIELKRLQRELGITTLFVTHDQAEALSLSDRVCVMAHGNIEQFAAPEDIYHRPATAFVASFIGKPNRLAGKVSSRNGAGGAVEIGGGLTLNADRLDVAAGGEVELFLRQEAIELRTTPADGSLNSIPGTVQLRSFSGAHVQYVVRIGAGTEVVVEAPSSGAASNLEKDASVYLAVAPANVFALAAKGARS